MSNVQPDPLANAQTILRALLSDAPLPDMTPADPGPYADIVEELRRARALGGHEAVKRQWAVLAARHAELARLVSGDDLTPATPPALAGTDTWLPFETVVEALHRGETGDAELLARLYANRLAYDHAEKGWYLWAGHHWQADGRKQTGNLIAGNLAAQYLYAAAKLRQTEDKKEVETQLCKRAWSLYNRNRIKNVLDLASSQNALALAGNEWEANPWLLAVSNGVIDLQTGRLQAGRPGNYIRTHAPTPWQGIDAPAPRWAQFLQEIFAGDADLIAFMQRLLGYAVSGLADEHVLPVLYGTGRNGKDTLLETLAHVLGDLAGPISDEVLLASGQRGGGATPHLCALRSLRLAWVNESSEGQWFNVAQVKQITGGGQITARPLYGNPVRFNPQHLLMLVTNHRPRANADDYALWKRLLLIPFRLSFVDKPTEPYERQRDPHLGEKLRAEAPGILAWLVKGCLAWQKKGLNPPETVTAATKAYQESEDDLAQFVAERCLESPQAQAKASELYSAYRQWAEGYGLKPLEAKRFGERLEKRYKRKRTASGNVYCGLGLLKGAE